MHAVELGALQRGKFSSVRRPNSCTQPLAPVPASAHFPAHLPCCLQFFNWDTGSQLGEVIPHTKKNITCDFKPSRPFKAVFGGEDFNLSFYQVRGCGSGMFVCACGCGFACVRCVKVVCLPLGAR